MRLLMFGGTVFLGRALVEAAVERGHQVTLFNRGRTNPGLFAELEQVRGDREDLSALRDGQWDAALDTSGYVPRLVRQAVTLLGSRVQHYTLVSSISAYHDFSTPGMTEDALTSGAESLDHPNGETITGETYGPLKALCEHAAEQAMPGRVLVVRPGLIVGPHDPTDRFTYWPARVARGGEVLAPGTPDEPVQFIDVRDLAAWMLSAVEQGLTGTFNATGPTGPTGEPCTMGSLLDTCRAVSGSDATITWVSEPFLRSQEVTPFVEVPLWVPGESGESVGFHRVDCSKAVAAGLRFRPVSETVRDTLAWVATGRPADCPWRAGLARDREATLLARWHEQRG